MADSHRELHTSSPADFTAEPTKDRQAPWQPPLSPRGENAWDRSKEARDHPEWYTTAYGTTDPWEQQPPPPPQSTAQNQQEKKKTRKLFFDSRKEEQHHADSPFAAGHTVQHGPSPRSVHRDLNNI